MDTPPPLPANATASGGEAPARLPWDPPKLERGPAVMNDVHTDKTDVTENAPSPTTTPSS